MENTEKRVTKAMRYADIISLLTGDVVENGTDTDTAVQFIRHELVLLAKKNSSSSGKLTPRQEENERYRALIIEYLSIQDTAKTCTEIAADVPELSGFNNQRVASLMKRLVDDGQVVKTVVKNKSLFKLA